MSNRVALAILFAGIVLRALITFPTGIFPGDADHVLTGLTALRILDGDLAVFYAADRHGALESYLQVPFILAFGPTRTMLALAPLLSLTFGLFCFWRLAVCIEGEERAGLSLLYAAFAPAVALYWTVLPNGYAETFALGVATLWMAAEKRFAAMGLCAGLALWCSPLALAPVAAAILGVWRQSRRFESRGVAAALLGSLIGFSPWILYNLRYDFVSLRSPYVGVDLNLGTTTKALFTNALPALLLHHGPEWNATQPFWPLIALLLLIGMIILIARHANRYFLPLATAALSVALFLGSQAVVMNKVNARYLIFVTPLVAFALAQYRRRLAVVAAVLWIGYNASQYDMPWSSLRKARVAALEVQQQLVERLAQARVRVISGLYWDTYPIWFDSQRTIIPATYPADADYLHQRPHAGATPWAAVISPDSAPFVTAALANLGVSGRVERFGERQIVLAEASDLSLPLRVADEAERLWRLSLR